MQFLPGKFFYPRISRIAPEYPDLSRTMADSPSRNAEISRDKAEQPGLSRTLLGVRALACWLSAEVNPDRLKPAHQTRTRTQIGPNAKAQRPHEAELATFNLQPRTLRPLAPLR